MAQSVRGEPLHLRLPQAPPAASSAALRGPACPRLSIASEVMSLLPFSLFPEVSSALTRQPFCLVPSLIQHFLMAFSSSLDAGLKLLVLPALQDTCCLLGWLGLLTVSSGLDVVRPPRARVLEVLSVKV